MLGMDHGQRSNAVGSQPSYLPSGDTGRDGGGTYSGQATEPTIQDYENFFGPSARDIKTDLQRFKRHGRWHLPDILQGPNPWLTDRIDGLITDATNSPFTTKILPYRYKEDVDGKIKWNVWSFDEGMASRVPYESAARTLTQSKRSFAGYMVRQGMAIVLEHNFMMTPKGRENFKNQLNQLIGSIQYTNDLDVHMALILAPSYQKTMSERYYSTDKSPSQMCREFADLFGMMQKNVNALDILIEEGKAVLRTWGGPMPDFLLCNSKLTFQMTMTPEKTNYITQGIDGVKRLRQGPDLGTYRGLSVIHTRSFAMETGQHPRDVVRTAEYYRILPNKKNVTREFEFYNEERDTWFTLSFQELLKCARYHVNDGFANDGNAPIIDGVYHSLSGSSGHEQEPLHFAMQTLGAYRKDESEDPGRLDGAIVAAASAFTNYADLPVRGKTLSTCANIRRGINYQWSPAGYSDSLGVRYIEPLENEVWDDFKSRVPDTLNTPLPISFTRNGLTVTPMTRKMQISIFSALKGVVLNDPFVPGRMVNPGTAEWHMAYLFYLELIKRKGLPLDFMDWQGYAPPVNDVAAQAQAMLAIGFKRTSQFPAKNDISHQYLALYGAVGSVNHPLHMSPSTELSLTVNGLAAITNIYTDMLNTNGKRFASKLVFTYEFLQPLLSEYSYQGRDMLGIDVLIEIFRSLPADHAVMQQAVANQFQAAAHNTNDCFDFTNTTGKTFQNLILSLLSTNNGIVLKSHADGNTFSRLGISTIPMTMVSMSHLFHPSSHDDLDVIKRLKNQSMSTYGQLNYGMFADLQANYPMHPICRATQAAPAALGNEDSVVFYPEIFMAIRKRIFEDPMEKMTQFQLDNFLGPGHMHTVSYDDAILQRYITAPARRSTPVTSISTSRVSPVVDLNEYFDDPLPNPAQPSSSGVSSNSELQRAQDVEIVVIRPNIEHNMLGVIMGLGGNDLGNTLWGQTELSVYDDSMHGIWGMSYKYHERAIVFNEKNLIRLWDIAYDGYNGGKDDTYVDWTADDDVSNSSSKFKQHTLDLGSNYRGPSMMVLAFAHDKHKPDQQNRPRYEHFKRNWPSPIVFYDSYDPNNPRGGGGDTLPLDYDNLQTVNVEDFRVFNNSLYYDAYSSYKSMMPDFRTLHVTRKSAGQGSADAETATDCLAFQGSMRIKENGTVIQAIDGSGHHGPDYTGVASVRAGKGQKTAGVAPTLHRLI